MSVVVAAAVVVFVAVINIIVIFVIFVVGVRSSHFGVFAQNRVYCGIQFKLIIQPVVLQSFRSDRLSFAHGDGRAKNKIKQKSSILQ